MIRTLTLTFAMTLGAAPLAIPALLALAVFTTVFAALEILAEV